MSIYKVSYISGQYRVMGYLGIPHELDGTSVLRQLQMTTGEIRIEEVVAVSLEAVGGDKVLQAKTQESKYPAFVYCRGGIGHVGKVRTWWIEHFLRHGTFVFAPCYRGSEGSEGRDEFGGDDVEDVRAAIEMIQTHPLVDAHRISVMGFSRGSINACAAVVESPFVRSLVLWGGVADLAKTYEERVQLRRMLRRVVGGTPRRAGEAYMARSPAAMAPSITCPVLIMHGTADVQVDYSHALLMAKRLQESGNPAAIMSYERLGHHMHPLVFEAVVARMFDWIRKIPR